MDFFEIGERIREERLRQGLSQVELANQAGLHHMTVSLLERGEASDIGLRKVINLFHALGLELTLRPKGHGPSLADLAREREQGITLGTAHTRIVTHATGDLSVPRQRAPRRKKEPS